jgi:putative ubiquitin-RnfH superfamily antitoxin RatB of RatAB toxin-antitoxin module
MVERMNDGELITVEVAYALPHRQALISLAIPPGTTAIEAARQSGIAGRFDDVNLDDATLGVFGQIVAHGQVLREGDRVEIYRALTADPKVVRKARAERASSRRKRE